MVNAVLADDEEGVVAGEYAMACFDVLRFKAVNDLFGADVGDKLILHIADVLSENISEGDIISHPGSDRFMFFARAKGERLQKIVDKILADISDFDVPFEIACNMGIYVTGGKVHSVDTMIDRAVLAQSKIKGSYTIKYNYYTEELRNTMLGEQEIVGMMSTALANKHFIVYYQPQYNHSTGMLLGAEALVRWNHPEKGIISPGVFIPIFERNGFITKLDLYVFEQVCAFVRKCLDNDIYAVPISTNFSRHDIFLPDFVESLEEIRTRYDVPVKYLRVEITESAVMGSSAAVNQVVQKLHDYGYVVEMDDFGSGYSSLNVLKDIELDVIKLDMMFMSEHSESKKGGTILSSIVRMAKWLRMPVIAEGVETIKQADFLRSIGCNYIQGYLYSKPIPEDEFVEILSGSTVGMAVPQMRLIDTLNACDFWDPKSQETLIFSNYVGAASIFDYHDGKVEILRVNQKYLQELGMNLSEKELVELDLMEAIEDSSKQIYSGMLERAISTMEEQECEVWCNIKSPCCGTERICIRSSVKMIGKSDDNYLFYATIRNVTAEKNRFLELEDMDKRFRVASEQANIYFWEYIIATKEMRPCFRCMRDLGLPPVVRNYPEPLIEQGIIPEDYADMYRQWMDEVAAGDVSREEIVPLTVGRVPFMFKYTMEYDENGRPLKAFGSATFVNGTLE
ncbi:MAG: EAL domain-containing protein [Lachnospiraceae bacterium]|nr:EAL domain-containing protein [Lachnospiraceae bacterium]